MATGIEFGYKPLGLPKKKLSFKLAF